MGGVRDSRDKVALVVDSDVQVVGGNIGVKPIGAA